MIAPRRSLLSRMQEVFSGDRMPEAKAIGSEVFPGVFINDIHKGNKVEGRSEKLDFLFPL